jgi:TonB family protein
VKDGVGARPQDTIDASTIFLGKDLDRKVIMLTKPEPSYTEEARRAGIRGTVVIKAVFAWNGAVTYIRTSESLPLGLTEQAIRAAQQIKFVPASKDGKYVSMWMQLEYNFNLY